MKPSASFLARGPVLVAAGLCLACTLDYEPAAEGVQESAQSSEEPACDSAFTYSGYQWAGSGTLGKGVDGSSVDFEGQTVATIFRHKYDVDTFEDGCVSEAEVHVQVPGCRLSLFFEAREDRTGLHLADARWPVDSDCRGFPDDTEGNYQLARGDLVLDASYFVPESSTRVQCFEDSYTLRGTMTLAAGDNEVTIGFADTAVAGSIYSLGRDSAICPAQE